MQLTETLGRVYRNTKAHDGVESVKKKGTGGRGRIETSVIGVWTKIKVFYVNA